MGPDSSAVRDWEGGRGSAARPTPARRLFGLTMARTRFSIKMFRAAAPAR